VYQNTPSLGHKNVPIYKKLIKEHYFKRLHRRGRDTPTINVVGKLFYMMLGRVISPKYLYLGSPVVDVHIERIMVPNSLIYQENHDQVQTPRGALGIPLNCCSLQIDP